MNSNGFYYGTAIEALKESKSHNKSLAYMPHVVTSRLGNPSVLTSEVYSHIWNFLIGTLSIKVTGNDSKGKSVVLYVHQPHYFSNLDNVRHAKTVNGAMVMPKKAFDGLLRKVDGKTIFSVDYEEISKSPSEVSLDEALQHPEVIPFLGKYNAAAYVRSRNVSVNSGGHLKILREDEAYKEPLARFLSLSDKNTGGGLNGFENLESLLRFPAIGAGLKSSGLKLESLKK